MRNSPISPGRQRSVSETLFAETVAEAEQLYVALRTNRPQPASFRKLNQILAALPLAQNDCARLRCRLLSAARHVVASERQAAAYEIGLLAKRLRAELSQLLCFR